MGVQIGEKENGATFGTTSMHAAATSANDDRARIPQQHNRQGEALSSVVLHTTPQPGMGKGGFNFPFFYTMFHMLVSAFAAYLLQCLVVMS